jgi:hypothetical protein
MSIKRKAQLVLITGIFIRLLIMPYNQFIGTWETARHMITLFEYGMIPAVYGVSWGSSFYLPYILAYIPYRFLGFIGAQYDFFLFFFMRVLPLIADVIVFYVLYEIASHYFGGGKKAVAVASAYFLNPYVIWQTTIIGHPEQLVAAFILLSMLFLLRKKVTYSGFFLAIAVFSRYIPILILLGFVWYVWKNNSLGARRVVKLITGFAVASLALITPYLYTAAILYSQGKNVLLSWLTETWSLGAYVHTVIPEMLSTRLPTDFNYNFTGFLASIGLWPYVEAYFSIRTLFLLIAIATVLIFRHAQGSGIATLNRLCTMVFILFMLVLPLTQHHYLLWVFPFLLLGAYVFRDLPRYLPLAIWVFNMLIDPVVHGWFQAYFWWIRWPNWMNPYPWPFQSIPLWNGLSVVHGTLLALAVVYLLRKLKRARASDTNYPQLESRLTSLSFNLVRAHTISGDAQSTVGIPIIALLGAYGTLEISRLAYFTSPTDRVGIVNYAPIYFAFIIGIITFFLVRSFVISNKHWLVERNTILTNAVDQIISLVYLGSILAFFLVSIQVDFSPFLILMSTLLVYIFMVNRCCRFLVYLQVVTGFLVVVYVGTFVALYRAGLIILPPLFLGWIYTQIRSDMLLRSLPSDISASTISSHEDGTWFINPMLRRVCKALRFTGEVLRNPRYLTVALSILLAVSYIPLTWWAVSGSIHGGQVDYDVNFRLSGRIVDYKGFMNDTDFGPVVGSIHSKNSSWVLLEYNLWPKVFWSHSIDDATNITLTLHQYPEGWGVQKINYSQAGGIINFTTENWSFDPGRHLTNSSYLIENGTLILRGVFDANQYGYNQYFIRNLHLLDSPINTTQYPILVAQAKSTDRLVTLGVVFEDGEGITLTQSDHYPDWHTIARKMPKGKIVESLWFGMDEYFISGRFGISGPQTTYYKDVAFLPEGAVTVLSPQFRMTLNNKTILEMPIAELKQENLPIEIPITEIADVSNLVNISLGTNSSFLVNALTLNTNTDGSRVYPRAWQTVPFGATFIAFLVPVELGLVVWSIRKLKRWTDSVPD